MAKFLAEKYKGKIVGGINIWLRIEEQKNGKHKGQKLSCFNTSGWVGSGGWVVVVDQLFFALKVTVIAWSHL